MRKRSPGYLCLSPSIKLDCLIDMQFLLASGAKMSGNMILPKLLAEFAEIKGAWAYSLVEIVVLSCVFSVMIKEV